MSDFNPATGHQAVPSTASLPPARARTRSALPAVSAAAVEAPPLPPGESAYDVGYGKPPTKSRFKPGQSGNPRGRPRRAKGLNTIVRETLGAKVAVRTAAGTSQISRIEAVLQKSLEKAMKGDARAQLALMNLWAKAVPDAIENAGTDVQREESLSAVDLAILEVYRASLMDEGDEQ